MKVIRGFGIAIILSGILFNVYSNIVMMQKLNVLQKTKLDITTFNTANDVNKKAHLIIVNQNSNNSSDLSDIKSQLGI